MRSRGPARTSVVVSLKKCTFKVSADFYQRFLENINHFGRFRGFRLRPKSIYIKRFCLMRIV